MAIINEAELKKDTIDGIMQYHGVSEKRANKICTDSYMENIMDAMFEAQTSQIVDTPIKDKWRKRATRFTSVKDNLE